MARRMVAQWECLSLVLSMDQTQDMVFLGKEIATQREVSEYGPKVDAEIASLVLVQATRLLLF